MPAGNLIRIHRLICVICKPIVYFLGQKILHKKEQKEEERMATALSSSSHLASGKGSALIPKPLSPPLFAFHSHKRRVTTLKQTKIYAKIGKDSFSGLFSLPEFFFLPWTIIPYLTWRWGRWRTQARWKEKIYHQRGRTRAVCFFFFLLYFLLLCQLIYWYKSYSLKVVIQWCPLQGWNYVNLELKISKFSL